MRQDSKPQVGSSSSSNPPSTPSLPTSSKPNPSDRTSSQPPISNASTSRTQSSTIEPSTSSSSDAYSRDLSSALEESPSIDDSMDSDDDVYPSKRKVKGRGGGNGRGSKRGRVSSSSASTSTSNPILQSSTPSTRPVEVDDGFARAQAMGLKLTREEFERSKAGLSAFLKAERAPSFTQRLSSSSSISTPSSSQSSRSSPQLESRDGKFSRQNSRSSLVVGEGSSNLSQNQDGSSLSSSSSSSTKAGQTSGFSSFASRTGKAKDSSTNPDGTSPMLSFFTAVVVPEDDNGEPRISMLESAGLAEEEKRAKEKIKKKLAKEKEATPLLGSSTRTPKLPVETSPSTTSSDPKQRDVNLTFTPSTSLNRKAPTSSGSDFESNRFGSGSGMGSSINGSGSGSGGSRNRIGLGFSAMDSSNNGDDNTSSMEDSPSQNLSFQISHRNRILRERNESSQSSDIDLNSPNLDACSSSKPQSTTTPITSFKIHGDDNDEIDELSLRANVSSNGVLSLADPSTVPERAALAKALALEYQETYLNDAVDRLSLLDRVMETFTSPLRRRKEAKAREKLEETAGSSGLENGNDEGEANENLQNTSKSVRWAEEVPDTTTSSIENTSNSQDTPDTSISTSTSKPIDDSTNTSSSTSISLSDSARRHLSHARMSTRDHYDLMLHDLSPARDIDVQEAISHGGLPSDPTRPSASPIWATSANVSGFRHRLGRGLVEAGMVDESASQHLSPLSARARHSSSVSTEQLSLEGVERAGAALRQISGGGESSKTPYSVSRGLLFSSASPNRTIGESDEVEQIEGDQEDGEVSTASHLMGESGGPSLTRSPVRRGFGPFDPSPMKLGRPLSFNASPRSGLLNRMHSTGSINHDRLRDLSRDSSMIGDSQISSSQPDGHHGRMRSSSNDGTSSLNPSQSKFPGPGWGKAASQLGSDTISPAELFGYRNTSQRDDENPTMAGPSNLSVRPFTRVDSSASSISLASAEDDQDQGHEKQEQEEEWLPSERRQKVKIGRRSKNKVQEEASTRPSTTALEKRKTPEPNHNQEGAPAPTKPEKKPKEKRLVLGMADVTAEETLLPDGSRRVQLVSEELRSAIKSGKLEPPPPRYYVLPPHAGLSHEKPTDASYAGIIGAAILSATNHVLSLAEIYNWITATYPFYKPGDHVWMNGVRYNLSSHDCFAKQNRDRQNPGKGGLWTIPEQFVGKFKGGQYAGKGGNNTFKTTEAPSTNAAASSSSSTVRPAVVDEGRASPSLSATGSAGTGETKKRRGKQSQAQIAAQTQAAQAQAVAAQSTAILNTGTFSRPRYQSPSASIAPTPTSNHSKKSNDDGYAADTSSNSMLPPTNSQTSNTSSNSRRRAHSTDVEGSGSQPNSPTNSRRKVAKRIKLVSRGGTAEAEEKAAQQAGEEGSSNVGGVNRPPLRTLSRNKLVGRGGGGAISASEDEQDLDDDAITPNRPGLSVYASSGHGSRGSRRVPMLTTAGSSPPSSPPDSMMPPPPRSIGTSVGKKRGLGMDEDSNYSSSKQFLGKSARNSTNSGWAASPYGSPLVNRRGANNTVQSRLPNTVRTSTLLTSPQRLVNNAGERSGNGSPYRLPYRSPISSLRGSVGMERGGSNGSREGNKTSQFGNSRLATSMGLNASPIPASPGGLMRAPMLTGSPIKALMSPAGARLQHALSNPNQSTSSSSSSQPPNQITPGIIERTGMNWNNAGQQQQQVSIGMGMGLDSTPGRMTPNRWGAGLSGTPSPMRRFGRSPINGGAGMGMGMSGLGGHFLDDAFDAQGNLDYELSFTDMTGLASTSTESPSRAAYGGWNGNGGV